MWGALRRTSPLYFRVTHPARPGFLLVVGRYSLLKYSNPYTQLSFFKLSIRSRRLFLGSGRSLDMGPRPRKLLGGAVPFLSVACKLLLRMQRGTAGRVEKPCASAFVRTPSLLCILGLETPVFQHMHSQASIGSACTCTTDDAMHARVKGHVAFDLCQRVSCGAPCAAPRRCISE